MWHVLFRALQVAEACGQGGQAEQGPGAETGGFTPPVGPRGSSVCSCLIQRCVSRVGGHAVEKGPGGRGAYMQVGGKGGRGPTRGLHRPYVVAETMLGSSPPSPRGKRHVGHTGASVGLSGFDWLL